MRRLLSYVAATLAVLMVSAGLAAPAQAGPQHYGTDPYYSGCSANSFPYRTFPIYNTSGQPISAVAELWYSRICETNWIRVSGNPAGGATDKYIAAANGQW
ncbi:hypothetical protein ACGFI4_14320 [Micromonospora carbonacea]|uniref:hypothetical protein n=1 Tax=Micromonospora carbonacea TaxID=47853 RepID=UPI00372100C2